jgi:Ribonucleases P/MRP protein subunit POP1/POPLD (NUC188) domain
MPPQQQLLPQPSYLHRDGEESRGEEMKQHSLPSGKNDAADVAMIATTEKSKRSKTKGTPSKTPSASKTAAPSSSASVNWIPTHVWHAKRFHMLHQHCGWNVPLLHYDRGTKAALRLVGGSGHDDEEEKKCLVQDVTWRMQPLVVVVPIKNVTQNNMSLLQTALARVIVPPISLLLHGMEGKEEAANVVENDDGVVMGQGMIHGVDLFPGAALGPVVWMLRKTPLLVASGETNDGIVSEAASSNMYLYLWVDPSIRESAIEVLNGVTIAIRFVEPSADAEIEGHFETSAVSPAKYLGTCSATEGIAYLQLRGKHTLRCLVAALESFVGSSSGPTFDLGPLNQIVASIAAGKANEMSQIGEFKVMSLPSLTTRDNGPHPPVNDIILISQCPRDPSLACNYGVCGYDIICDPSLASALHLALVVKGGACPIGLTEEAALQLECEPPIPIFPRDYPDTQQGKAYWASHSSLTSSSSSSKASTKQQSGNDNWKTIRTFFEGGKCAISKLPLLTSLVFLSCQRSLSLWHSGQGRIRQQHAALVPLNWHALVSDSDDIDECRIACTDDHSYQYNKKHIVMVRGEAFGQPFVDALIGCCTTAKKNTSSFALDDSKTNKPHRHRRQRRLTQNPTHAVLAPLLSKKQATEHQGYLTKLLESLSLPAVLLCHVQISNGGPGTISSGALIHAMDESAVEALGFCTIGAFSPSRGQFYGLAIVGAARLLRALVASTTATLSPIDSVRSLKQQHQHAAVLVPRLGSDSQALLRQVQLRVRILDKTVWHEASLALML